MSRADGVLVVVVSRKPFEMFLARIKGAEYRDRKWAKRLLDQGDYFCFSIGLPLIPYRITRVYHTLRVFLGYQRNRPCIEMPITAIDWGMPNPEWTCGIIAPEKCFRIHVDLENLKEINL